MEEAANSSRRNAFVSAGDEPPAPVHPPQYAQQDSWADWTVVGYQPPPQDTWQAAEKLAAAPSRSEEDMTPAGDPGAPGSETVAMLRGIRAPQATKKKRKRNRDWDKGHNAVVATWLGIPTGLHEKILGVALERNLPVGVVVQSFLEYAEAEYTAGRIRLAASPYRQKMTLYPKAVFGPRWYQRSRENAVPRSVQAVKRVKGGGPQDAHQPDTKVRSYRGVDRALQERIKNYAHEVIRVGDVARFFLEHGLNAYEQGILEFAV